jgi:proteic killer suppression protein
MEMCGSTMIKSFRNQVTEDLFRRKAPKGIQADVAKRAFNKMFMINAATRVEDLRVPPGNRLELLAGDRAGQWSVRVNNQWRICFEWKGVDAFNVEFVDYH